jgi:serine/threonine protein kinase
MMPVAGTTLRNATLFGKYQLMERLGRGGMAEVWKARITGPAGFSRTLVIKRILPHLVEDEHFVQMFVAEARLSARLNHTNIVQVFELGDVEGEFYLAMEYVHGRDLVNTVRAQLLRGMPMPGMAAFAVREVCRALAYAHGLTDDQGQPLRLIHRDVSPSNVMISFDGAVKLLDFGIAKALADANENKTVTGTLKGKFGYMSPEQVEGKDIDHRADLFAAGVVLHEVLTGKRLFKGGSDLQTIAMVRDAKVEPPSASNPSVPPELDAICLKALARDPDDRWRGCDEMAAALDEVVHQLKWGAERMASTLRELFPDEPTSTTGVAVAPALTMSDLRRAGPSASIELRPRLPVRRIAILGGGLVVGGALAWLIAANMRGRVERTVVLPTAVVPAPVVSPAHVSVRVVSMPPGADVYFGEEREPRGQTPFALSLPRSDRAQHVTVRMHGYQPQTSELVPDADSRLQLTLVKLAPVVRVVKKPAKRPGVAAAPKPAADRQPDLRRGDVVDPFK